MENISTAKRVRVPTVLQIEAVECGAASLSMVLASFRRWVPLSDLRTACRVSRDGATASGIMEAATEFDLESNGRIISVDELQGHQMPAIIWWKRRHFVVLEGAKNGTFFVQDPALGPVRYSQEDFTKSFSGAVITFEVTEKFEKGGYPYRTLPSLMRRLRGTEAGLWFAIISGLLAMLPGLLLAPISSSFIDYVLIPGQETLLPVLIGALIVITCLRVVFISLEYTALARVQSRIAFGNNSEFLMRMFRLPLLFFAGRNIGDLVQRMSYSSAVAKLAAGYLAASLISMVALVAYLALMIFYNLLLAVIVMSFTALNVVALRSLIKRRKVGQGLLSSEMGRLQSITIGSIQSIETVKASGIEDDVFGRWTGQQTKVVNAEAALVSPTAILGAVPTVLTLLTTTSILTIGGFLVVKGQMTIGSLLAFQALVAGINAPVNMLVATSTQIQMIQSNLESLDDVLDYDLDARFTMRTPTEVLQESLNDVRSSSAVPLSGSVVLSDVEFGFTKGNAPLITNFNLELHPGKRIALIGPSGSGKSTIGSLIGGLYMPWSGSITYDGREISEIDPLVFSSGLAKVDQSVMLFSGTIRQNITMWDTSIPDELIVKALADAQVLDQILLRPHGIDTDVIEGGLNFSSGEIQRLEIARALLRNPSILIMDEATSNLDTTTEKLMDSAVRSRGCSTIIIAHRLSTIRDADEIIVLDRGGVIAERGTNQELLSQGGIYSQLVASSGDGGDIGT